MTKKDIIIGHSYAVRGPKSSRRMTAIEVSPKGSSKPYLFGVPSPGKEHLYVCMVEPSGDWAQYVPLRTIVSRWEDYQELKKSWKPNHDLLTQALVELGLEQQGGRIIPRPKSGQTELRLEPNAIQLLMNALTKKNSEPDMGEMS